MVSGTRLEGGGGQVIPVRIRKTIQSIKEIVGNHSDADIYAVLKETNMDPNETAQKLLNQDPFHEVKRKRDKKKEFTGYKLAVDPRKHTESIHWEKSNKPMHLNAPRGGLAGSYVPDARINKQFRIVRDNRLNQTFNKDAKSDSLQHSPRNEHVNSNISERRSTRIVNDQKLLNSCILDGQGISQNMNASCSHGLDHEKNLSRASRSRDLPLQEIMIIPQSTNLEPERAVVNSSALNSSSVSVNSVIGVYSSSSDPVHVPSVASRSAGSVGAIRREVGAVGVKKQSSDVQPTTSEVSNHSQSVILGGTVILSTTESLQDSASNIKKSQVNTQDSASNIKKSQVNQVSNSNTVMPTTSNRRGVQNNSKQHLQIFNHQRASQPNMEWKPKSQKLKNDSSSTLETFSVLESSTDNAFSSSLVNAIDLTDKLSNVNIRGEQHVIIPQHLRVPEAECTKFTFGSFGEGPVSSPGFLSTQQTIGSVEQPEVTTSVSNSAFVPVGPNNGTSVEVGHLVDCQAGTSRSTSSASAEELERPPSGNNQPLNSQSIESYADIGLVQSHSPPFNSQQSQRIQETPTMPSFLPYDTETSYVTPFFQTSMDDNIRGQSLASQPEILNLHSANSNPLAPTAITQQQQQQQQALTQIYPQVHIPHYPNFMPYRHILSPVYVPPMALPSYSSNPAYAHPSTGNSYLMMTGGSSHLPTGGMKYAPSQYKPLPAGSPSAYGNYSSPATFAIGTPSPIGGATGLEDMMRIKYKDNNLYVPNQQAEPSDMWMQTPRELPSLQSMPYYNLSGHTAHPPAFVSAHAAAAAASGHASFNAVAATAQPSPLQYPGMYHQPQPASIAAPHHLVHQQVPPSVGLAAGGPQVGAFQQSQLGRLNWTTNF
ncbi:uncharacterized protein LOC110110515 isoform X2 [Dendrobium catenatum]|uniref:uncharacterized protein LOC110110515 isoform X2 n=1 Tax=Dendrobium catenatum TaxID=906689 RepID=UPI00109F9533|nr:uncharacterized protein LOC110110515 isoform X2 [Dendrobium catenatum]